MSAYNDHLRAPPPVGLLLGCAALTALLALVSFNVSSTVMVGLLAGTVLVALVPMSLRADKRAGQLWSFRSLLLADLALGYGVGGIYASLVLPADVRLRTEPHDLTVALVIGLVSAFALVAGYRLGPGPAWQPRVNSFLLYRLDHLDSLVGLVLLEIVGWCARVAVVVSGDYFHVADSIASSSLRPFLNTLEYMPSLAVVLLAARRWGRGTSLGMVWLLVAIEMVWFLPSGSRQETLTILFALTILRGQMSLRFKARWLIAGVTLVLAVFPLLSTYRQMDDSYSGTVQSSANVAVGETFSGTWAENAQAGVESVLERFSDVLDAAIVVETPINTERIGAPFSEYLETMLLPRAIAQDKPDPGLYGNEFGRVYGVLQPNDFVTSLAVGQGLYFYMIGGWLGLILGMMSSGFLYRLLDGALAPSSRTIVALRATIAFQVALSIGTIWPLGFVGLVKSLFLTTVCILLIAVVAKQVRRHESTMARQATTA